MTWCPQAASHYVSKCRPRFMSTYGVTRPQWVHKLLSQHCFRRHFTLLYPHLTCLSTEPLSWQYSHQHICFLCHLLIFHNQKHRLNLLSSITKALLTHTLASFWRKQSCLHFTVACCYMTTRLICVWLNGWVNNREAGDLRRYRTHYDVTVMIGYHFMIIN